MMANGDIIAQGERMGIMGDVKETEILDSDPMATSPMTTAVSSIKALGAMVGAMPR